MLISLEWLADFVELPPVEDMGDKLASVGIELESLINPAATIRHVVVADVQTVAPHPNAERLQVCQVFDGTSQYQVVCGAPNVAAGQRVALARVGAAVPGLPGIEIVKRAIRGVESEGMLCSRAELGLEDKSAGIWELPATFELGKSIVDEAQLTPTMSLGITPNRADLLSHLGVAREIAAATGKRVKPAKWRVTEKGPDIGPLARVLIEDSSGCRRYVGRVVRGLKVGPSPRWLKERLERLGQRSINNVVDATNYVLFEMGQPLHAFDLSRLAVEAGCPTVRVRRAVEGERLKTLDGVERTLFADDLVIADANRPVALAGVMGGADTEVSESTVSVLIESAWFDPTRVRQTARRHGLRTEGSQRFERGADIGAVIKAVDRCAQLLTEIADGDVAKGILEVAQKMEAPKEIAVRLERIPKILGVSLLAETVVQLLEPLEIRCTARTEAALVFQPPTFRPDITREIDLIEELARRHGYDRIPERLPDASGELRFEPPVLRASDVARQALLAAGCSEAVTYGFGSPSAYADLVAQEGEPLRLLNPLGEELSAMRTSLIPGLCNVLAHNLRHGRKHVRLFEVGTTFHGRTPGPDENERDRDLPREELRAAFIIAGGRHDGRWYEHHETVDFSDLAGIVDTVIEAFDPALPGQRLPGDAPMFNPYCSAIIRVGDITIGRAGQVLPEQLKRYDIAVPVFVAELSITALAGVPRRQIVHQSLPKFPGTRRDLAVVADRGITAESIRQFLAARAGGDLGPEVVERVALFDVYEGKPIPPTHVSLGFAIEYRSRARTLTDAEVGNAFQQVLRDLKRELGVEVRQ